MVSNECFISIYHLRNLICYETGKNDIVRFKVKGTSMSPLFDQGDYVIIGPIVDEIRIGGIYVFLYKKRLIVHRLLDCNGDMLDFKGDNSFGVERIEKSALVGRVKYVEKKVGLLLNAMEDDTDEIVTLSRKVNNIFRTTTSIESAKQSVEYRDLMKMLHQRVEANCV